MSSPTDDQDLFDGELVVRVLQLMTYIQQKTANETHNNNKNSIHTAITTTATTDKIDSIPYSERLELAVLFFFEQFRRQYIGDHGRSNKIYQVLFKHLGNDEVHLNFREKKGKETFDFTCCFRF